MDHMRTAPLLAAIALVLAPPAAAQTESAAWHAAIPRAELMETYASGEIRSVHFLNRHVGWAVGHSRTATLIFRTADGGRSWDRLTLFDGERTAPQFAAVRFADANHGWIAGDRHVLRTRDGGETWEPVDVPLRVSRVAANAMLALGPDAVMIGSNSVNGQQIRVTVDGGRTWRVSTVSEHGNDDVVSLAFAPPDRFFAVTASAHRNRGGIHRSRDGGRSWEPVVQGQQPLRGLAFHGPIGLAVGDGVAYRTEDGGETWRRGTAPGMRHAVRFVDADHAIAVGENPGVAISGDGGRSWRPGPSPNPAGRLVDLALVDAGWIFAAGGYGANALFHFVDPNHRAPIAGDRMSLPHPIRLPDDRTLPGGVYDVVLAHRGEAHVLELIRVGPADGAEPEEDAQRVRDCGDPCGGWFPIDLEYAVEDVGPDAHAGAARRLFSEPDAAGVAVVVDAVLGPPDWLGQALAALGGQAEPGAGVPAVRPAAGADSSKPAVYRVRVRRVLDRLAPGGSPGGRERR